MAENSTESKELTPAQHRLIAALLVARNTREACKAANIAERTAYTWLADPRFLAALSSAEGGQLSDATRRLLNLADTAIDTLEAVLSDATAAASVKVRAAGLVLDQLLALRELKNVESRLAALEAALYAKPEP